MCSNAKTLTSYSHLGPKDVYGFFFDLSFNYLIVFCCDFIVTYRRFVDRTAREINTLPPVLKTNVRSHDGPLGASWKNMFLTISYVVSLIVNSFNNVSSIGEQGNTRAIFRHTVTMSHAYIQVVCRFHCKIIVFCGYRWMVLYQNSFISRNT
jgi:hypothetical protein